MPHPIVNARAVGEPLKRLAPSDSIDPYNFKVVQFLSYSLKVWTVILLDEVEGWYSDLVKSHPSLADAVTAAIDKLEADGPTLGRPLVDKLKGSTIHNLKELRPISTSKAAIRILFAFDPTRQAILLVAGDKAGNWNSWYTQNIPVAEDRFGRWLIGEYENEE